MKINRQDVHEKYNGHCAYCGEEILFKAMQVDHIRAKVIFNTGHISKIPKYGVDDIKNLNPACRVCNNWKHRLTTDEFRHEIQQQVKRLRKYSAQFRMAERYGLVTETGTLDKFYFEKDQEVSE